jgi:hypothetical protein
MTGTKLGAPTSSDARRSAVLSSVFRVGQSMRSMANLPSISANSVPPPTRQTDLSAEEKGAVHSRDLKVCDPQAPRSLVRLRFNVNVFEEVSGMSEAVVVLKETTGRIGPLNHLKVDSREAEPEEHGEEEAEGEAKGKAVVLRNQFNFCDRATQGSIIIYIDQGTLTEAPKPKDCTGVSNQREIAAAYARDKQTTLHAPAHSASTVTRVMERVVNQNLDPNACCDFKYFNDPRDALVKDGGYTLPLWEFRSDALGGCAVGLIRWNPAIADLVAAVYGPTTSRGL